MCVSRYVGLLAAGVMVLAGCADMDDVPRVVRDAMKNVSYAEGSVISFMQKPVEKGFLLSFHGAEGGPITIPGEGYLVWIDENNGVRWPHRAKMVWVPKDPDQVQRILKQGTLPSTFRITKADDTPIGRMTWSTL